MQSKNDLKGDALHHVAEHQGVPSHTRWLAAAIQASIEDPRPSVSHQEVMAEVFGDA